MNKTLRKTVSAAATAIVILLFATGANAILPTHECTYCHSLHGSGDSAPFVPLSDALNVEVLCMGCHLTANGTTAAVQPHRNDGGYPAFHITCTDCHEVHDNMENWRVNDPNHAADDDAAGRDGTDVRPDGWPIGVNTEMVGREDPNGETPYAVIITTRADYDKDGVPDMNTTPTVTCDDAVVGDCYVSGTRHVIFENRDASITASSIHAWADHDEDTLQPSDASAWGETIPDLGDTNVGAPHDAICHMCHTHTSKNACGYDGSANCSLHNQSRTCTDCHLHDGCFDKGGQCTPWTIPVRDLQVISVDPSSTGVNSGQTVTITANVSNLGDANETVYVDYFSDIDGLLGQSTIIDLIPDTPTDTSLDWVTTTAGTHTIRAEAQVVLLEAITANNTFVSGTAVTVTGVDNHDIAATSVIAPAVTQQGDTVLVTVNITNQGTYTEEFFDVTLSSDLDGLIGTIEVTSLNASVSSGVIFNWDTTVATLGTHVLTGTADIADDVPGNDSATTSADVAVHDVAVTSVTAPPTVEVNSSTTVSVDITNEGGFTETFDVTLTSDQASDGNLPQVLSSGALAAGASTTLDFTWITTDAAETTHTLTATADTVPGETDIADNSASTTSEVIPPTTHDVAVDSVSAPATVDRGTSVTVSVQVSNNGGASETFDVTLSSDLDGTIQTLSSGLVSPGTTTIDFTWNTTLATTLGTHTLTAVADTVPGESNTGDNTGSTTSDVTAHDVAVDTVTAPASTTQGDTVTVSVDITNEGTFTETFNVTLGSDLDGTIQTLSSGVLTAGSSTTIDFSWNTTGATIGTHTLTATADTVTGETDTADNSASTTAEVASAGAVNDLAVTAITFNPPSPIATCGSNQNGIDVIVTIQNQGTVAEINFSVNLSSTIDGAFPAQQVATLASGASTDLTFSWNFNKFDTCGIRTFTATVDTVTGETDTADNTLSADMDIVN